MTTTMNTNDTNENTIRLNHKAAQWQQKIDLIRENTARELKKMLPEHNCQIERPYDVQFALASCDRLRDYYMELHTALTALAVINEINS